MESEWSEGLCSCWSSAGTACFSFCCTPCLYGRVKARQHDPNLEDFSYCNTSCCLWAVAGYFGLAGILQCINRSEMRHNYGIKGNGCTDMMVSCCCGCCALVQEEAEVKARNAAYVDATMTQGYQNQKVGMQYQVQHV